MSRRLPAATLRIAGGAVVVWIAFTWAHSVAVLSVAQLLAWAASFGPVRKAVAAAPGDDVHALLALNMIGDVGLGRVVIFPAGDNLVDTYLIKLPLPSVLGVSFPDGSSLVGVHLALVATNFVFVFLGAWLIALPQSRPSGRILLGSVMCALGAGSQALVSWSAGTGGDMILSMVATKVLEVDGPGWQVVVSGAGTGLSILLNGGVLGLGLATGWALGLAWSRSRPSLPASTRRGLLLVGATLVAMALFRTPLGPSIGIEQDEDEEDAPQYVSAQPDYLLLPPSMTPSLVTVGKGATGWEYRVNGEIRRIRCIGYNVITDGMGEAERAGRYDEDFSALRAARVNTILGWNQGMFDEVLLARAARHGLGVILHFNLDPAWDYTDPVLIQGKLGEIRSWARRHRESPALRMWGLGNEVIHKYADARDPRAVAFARFLVRAADLVHGQDPQHPVIYRDAEDVFIAPVSDALRAGRVERPWFVYGMNFFTQRLDTALAEGPSGHLGQPLLVSEFAPLGLGPNDRPSGYLKLWQIVRSHRDRVLGGCAYVWTTAGPEPVDRSLGLTDNAGVPIDDSFPLLADTFRREAAATGLAQSRVVP